MCAALSLHTFEILHVCSFVFAKLIVCLLKFGVLILQQTFALHSIQLCSSEKHEQHELM